MGYNLSVSVADKGYLRQVTQVPQASGSTLRPQTFLTGSRVKTTDQFCSIVCWKAADCTGLAAELFYANNKVPTRALAEWPVMYLATVRQVPVVLGSFNMSNPTISPAPARISTSDLDIAPSCESLTIV